MARYPTRLRASLRLFSVSAVMATVLFLAASITLVPDELEYPARTVGPFEAASDKEDGKLEDDDEEAREEDDDGDGDGNRGSGKGKGNSGGGNQTNDPHDDTTDTTRTGGYGEPPDTNDTRDSKDTNRSDDD